MVIFRSTSYPQPGEGRIQARDGGGLHWHDFSIPQHLVLLPSPGYLAPDDCVQPDWECEQLSNNPGDEETNPGSLWRTMTRH